MTGNCVHLFPQPKSSRSAEKIVELSNSFMTLLNAAAAGIFGNELWLDIGKAILDMSSTLQRFDSQIPGTDCEKTLC
jgi:hypothetical protein